MSVNFEKVKRYYENGFWNKDRVYKAVGRWIIKAEYEEITKEIYNNM